MIAVLRYYILPAILAVAIWILPLLAFGVYCFETSGGGPPAVGSAAAFALVLFVGTPASFCWLFFLRRRWKRRSDVQKKWFYGAPSILAALPGVGLLLIFVLALISERPSVLVAFSFLFKIFGVIIVLQLLAFAGAGLFYLTAYSSSDSSIS